MKISKLFHWLYAILMLLPICGIFSKVGYVMLNKNAYQSYSGSYSYEGYSNLSELDLEDYIGVEYTLHNSYPSMYLYKSDNSNIFGNYYLKFNNTYTFTPTNNYVNYIFSNVTNVIYNRVVIDCNTIVISILDTNENNSNRKINFYNVENYDYITPKSRTRFDLLVSTNINYSVELVSENIVEEDYISLYFTKTDTTSYLGAYYNHPATITTTNNSIFSSGQKLVAITDTTLSSVFYSSLQELDDTEFFSWAKDSFLVQPIMYIGNLFGITSPHPIFTLMSYWLAISIIWLVFDLVMYVPLLVHRWIDKGVIE